MEHIEPPAEEILCLHEVLDQFADKYPAKADLVKLRYFAGFSTGEAADALGITSIIVSHDIQEVSTVADCSFLISDGNVAASGSPEELTNASSDLVRQFMHGMADGPVAFHFQAPGYEEQLLGRDTE